MPPATSNASSSSQTAPTTTSSLLLCEALGFSPQLLLDDIINIANNAVQDGVNGMEEFLVKWVEEREERNKLKPKEPEPPVKGKKGKKKQDQLQDSEDMTAEIEQGLVAFQTLLEYHTDIAFDFFEAWSLRNIFFIPPDLEKGGVVVLPHYEGADLTDTTGKGEEKERDLVEQMEELRKRLDEQRRLTRMLTYALAKSKAAKRRADKRLNKLASTLPISTSSSGARAPLDHLVAIPQQLVNLYKQTSSLPPLEPWLLQANPTLDSSSQDSSGGSLALTGTGKREWEVGSAGYANWAVNRLVTGTRPPPNARDGEKDTGNAGPTWVDQMEQVTAYVGSARDVKQALEVFETMSGVVELGEQTMEVDDEEQ